MKKNKAKRVSRCCGVKVYLDMSIKVWGIPGCYVCKGCYERTDAVLPEYHDAEVKQ